MTSRRAARAQAARARRDEIKAQSAPTERRSRLFRVCWLCKSPLNGGRQSCPECQQAFVDNGYSWAGVGEARRAPENNIGLKE